MGFDVNFHEKLKRGSNLNPLNYWLTIVQDAPAAV